MKTINYRTPPLSTKYSLRVLFNLSIELSQLPFITFRHFLVNVQRLVKLNLIIAINYKR